MKEEGVSEVLGFVLILMTCVIFLSLFTAAVLPNMIKESEMQDTQSTFLQFSQMKSDMDTLCLADAAGVRRYAVFTESKTARLSLSYGKPVGVFREAVLTYESENILTEKLRLVLSKDGIAKNGRLVLPSSCRFAVSPADTAEQMKTGTDFRVEYTYLGPFTDHGAEWHLFSMRIL